MKNFRIISLTSILLSVLTLSVVNPVVAEADTNSQMYSQEDSQKDSVLIDCNQESSGYEETDVLTPYVKVIDNQFILSLPDNIEISQELKEKALQQLNSSNKVIREQHLTINAETMVAEKVYFINTKKSVFRSYGRTGILKTGWNFVRVGLDAGLTKDIITVGVAGAAGYLGFLVSGPGAAAVVAAVSGVVGNHVANIRDGVWFDYNAFTKTITMAGRQ